MYLLVYFSFIAVHCTFAIQSQVHDGKQGTDRASRGGARRSLRWDATDGDDSTEWLNCVDQLFEFQEVADDQKVHLASFHLEGEANQWWQWFRKAVDEEQRIISQEDLEDEVRAWLGPPDFEDFDEALSQVK
ncbi:hypothetical protein Pint_00561 [Pistacia integerrima]|uniref:Uncharacterized protein n=1 Tax=Pistacia integerrima TaxID=434235 RepID=A0ACC0ZP44_9ROSI|nr:hypothetical protein Pint_00561 [Pistacia integerrima]